MNQTIPNSLTDRDIVMNMLKDSKFALNSMSMALMETTNSQLRDIITNDFMASINEHYALSDLAISKQWYMAYLTPQEQLRNQLLLMNQK
ncbi:spore coat protein [Sporomusa sphaeroides]|uniref:spore coat protein n=1 Tax=Sporomusa sphaeroides TaxID=47679 RepID=UPI00202DE48A|nr:spore coat protein [Sporomusa sphaeroides]MCM0759884.1 spore coat protein [Sporomusa sphaeroides DSM 2875]HML34619.1 spore coat protein [Sporomusa sphaeroides]